MGIGEYFALFLVFTFSILGVICIIQNIISYYNKKAVFKKLEKENKEKNKTKLK